MKELVPVSKHSINETETLTCDGRALHAFLESKQHFADWMKSRIEKYGFSEGVDFIVFHNSMKNSDGRPTTEYALAIDMGKELAMVENNEKGRQVRRYFIECERRAKGTPAPKPRRTDAELNARSAAVSYRMMARMGVYSEAMRAVFAAKSVNLLTGEPLAVLLPHVPDNRDQWMSPTEIGEHFGIPKNTVGKILKSKGLHGHDDAGHIHSQPLSDKSPYSNKEVISYVYDPAVVLPVIEAALAGTASEYLHN